MHVNTQIKSMCLVPQIWGEKIHQGERIDLLQMEGETVEPNNML